jgi:hypothetical protein
LRDRLFRFIRAAPFRTLPLCIRACPELGSGDLHPPELSETLSRPEGVKIHTCYNALLLVFFDLFKSLQPFIAQLKTQQMNKTTLIILVLIFNAISSFGCLNTYQFKIFPVGVYNDTILTIDVLIRRTSQVEGNRWLELGLDSLDEWSEMWIINAFISKYDKNQKLFEKKDIGMTYSIGENYLDSLQTIYLKGFDKIKSLYSDLKVFKPTYISFCDFQQSCELIELSNDSITDKDYLIYDKKKYPVDIIRDTSYYAFGKCVYHPENILGLYANSIRIYKSDNYQLVISHIATGHEIGMGWITSDPEIFREKQAKDEPISLAKEFKPDIDFGDIRQSVYEEPLLHHGYGFDIFIIKE